MWPWDEESHDLLSRPGAPLFESCLIFQIFLPLPAPPKMQLSVSKTHVTSRKEGEKSWSQDVKTT